MTFFATLDAGQREELFARKRLALPLSPLLAGLRLPARDELDRAVAQAQENHTAYMRDLQAAGIQFDRPFSDPREPGKGWIQLHLENNTWDDGRLSAT